MFLKGQWMTVLDSVATGRLINFRIDYNQCAAERLSLSMQHSKAENFISSKTAENLNLLNQNEVQSSLLANSNKQISIKNLEIEGLTSANRKLKVRSGILGGSTVLVAIIASILIIK